jgi:hypothetical protein
VTVPYSMTPVNATYDHTKPYSCGGPGLKTLQPSSDLGSCSWDFTSYPVSQQFRWIEISGTTSPCSADSDCTPPDVCGLMATPTGSSPTFTRSCGKPIDTYMGINQPLYWTSDQICVLNNTFNTAPYSCSTALPVAFNPNTFANMYQCAPQSGSAPGVLGTCYSNGVSTDECCGCVDWWNDGVTVPPAPATSACANTNNVTWLSNVKPQLKWMKQGCPTSYVYPYDDVSSTFTCLVNEVINTPSAPFNGNINTTNYEVVFCPQ